VEAGGGGAGGKGGGGGLMKRPAEKPRPLHTLFASSNNTRWHAPRASRRWWPARRTARKATARCPACPPRSWRSARVCVRACGFREVRNLFARSCYSGPTAMPSVLHPPSVALLPLTSSTSSSSVLMSAHSPRTSPRNCGRGIDRTVGRGKARRRAWVTRNAGVLRVACHLCCPLPCPSHNTAVTRPAVLVLQRRVAQQQLHDAGHRRQRVADLHETQGAGVGRRQVVRCQVVVIGVMPPLSSSPLIATTRAASAAAAAARHTRALARAPRATGSGRAPPWTWTPPGAAATAAQTACGTTRAPGLAPPPSPAAAPRAGSAAT
jgi:hypothetical protein